MKKNVAIILLTLCVVCLFFYSRDGRQRESFRRMEARFDRSSVAQREKTTEITEYNLHEHPKHRFEMIRPYYERALHVKTEADTLIGYIKHLKDTLGENGARATFRELTKSVKVPVILKDRTSQLAEVIRSSFNANNKEQMEKLLDESCPDIMGKNADKPPYLAGGTRAQVQAELSMLRDEIAQAAYLVAIELSDEANSGCVFRFDTLSAVAIARGTTFKPGEKFEGDIFLYAFPSGFKVVKISVGGQECPVKKGMGVFTTIVKKPGINTWNGVLEATGENGILRTFPFRMECFVQDTAKKKE